MTIDEAIAKYKEITNANANCPAHCNVSCDKCVQEHEQLAEWLEELKAIKEMDLSFPQNFTKEQSDWIKAYCIKRNIEFYNKAIDDFAEKATKIVYESNNREINPQPRDMVADIHYKLLEIAKQLKEGGRE